MFKYKCTSRMKKRKTWCYNIMVRDSGSSCIIYIFVLCKTCDLNRLKNNYYKLPDLTNDSQ